LKYQDGFFKYEDIHNYIYVYMTRASTSNQVLFN